MAQFQREFPLNRNLPNIPSLTASLRSGGDATYAARIPEGASNLIQIVKNTDFTPSDEAFAQSKIAAAPDGTPQLQAQNQVDVISIFDKALFLTAVDETNRLRQWLMDFKAAVAAATSLADLKTRVAALNDLPQVPVNAAIQAMKNKAGTL